MGNQYAESFTLLGLGLVFILTRVYVRWTQVGPASFQLDDYLMPIAGAVFAVEVTLAYLVGSKYDGLTNSYMTDAARAALDPTSQEYYNRQMGSKIQIAGWSLYAMVLWLIKGSLAVFYSRLTYAATVNHIATDTCQPARSIVYVLVVMIPNVLTDLYLMSIPLPLLWTVKIGIRRKITLMGLFSGAIFIGVAAVIRAVIIITAGANGAIEGSKWACRESFVSIVVSNLPILQPLIRRGASKLGLSGLFSNSGGKESSYKYRGTSRRREGDYPLTSVTGNGTVTGTTKSKGDRKRDRLGLRTFGSVHHSEAMGSDEEVLVRTGGRERSATKGQITVTHETVIEREEMAGDGEGIGVARGGSVNGHGHGHGHGQESISMSSSAGNRWDGGMRKM
ncbi:uncharacterized protein DSM5745_07571 [Aspergillus mulundensis]|uniref:Rhodopsin domain-containing protein n=1 Tax=Aspergillus mulundensis TaxID=1810919 RepID=A0A3D8REC9_9EURO|nr:Uncharacterized protein DSM5745_07571 [Aspergillus mulundensis]RDW72399.1 Uncharacterized protein DSM5745_07571 [Aspergillus mulundensis]